MWNVMQEANSASTTDIQVWQNRRSDLRETMNQQITLTCFPTDVGLPAWLSDISASGMGLVLGWPVKVGSTIAVEWGGTVVRGCIAYCVMQRFGYRAGAKWI
jgi:hypothetical protein